MDPTILATELLKAVSSGQYVLALVAGVTLGTILMRRFGAKRWPWFGTPLGSIVVAISGSVGGALFTALMAGTPFSWPLVLKLVIEAVLVAGVALLPSAAATAKPSPSGVDISDALKQLNEVARKP